MNHSTKIAASSLLVFLTIAIAGCGDTPNAMQMRAEEFGYTADDLARELVARLQPDPKKSRKAQANPRAERVASMEADRGTGPERPDPRSMEAVVSDAVVKIRSAEHANGDSEFFAQVLAKIQESDQLPAEIKAEFETAIKAAYQQNH